MRAVKIFSLVFVSVMALLCAAVAFLLTTAPGLHFLIGQAKGYFPQLTQGTFNGSVLSLDAKEVVWEQSGLRFTGDFGWHMDFNSLLAGEVAFNDFYVQNVRSTVKTGELASGQSSNVNSGSSAEFSSQTDLQAPLPVHVHKITFKNISIDIDAEVLNLQELQSAFHWTGDGIDIPSIDLNGSWKEFPLTLKGAFSTKQGGKLLHLSDVAMHFGNNRLEVKGDVRFHATVPNLDLAMNIDAADFSEILNDIRGRAKGRLQVRGPVLMPLINADMTVRDLFAQGVSVGSLRLTGAMSAEENVSGGARLAVKGIELPGLRVDSFDADLSGSQTAHELKIAADSRLFRLNAGFNGALNAAMDAWKGTLSHFEVKTDYGPVALRDQMPLSFDTKGLLLDVGQFCLIHPHALICLQNDLQLDLLNKKAFDLHVALQKFDLSFFKRFIPGQFEATGVVKADAMLRVPQGFSGLPTGSVTLDGQALSTRYKLEQSDYMMDFDSIRLGFANDGEKINSKWTVKLAQNGELSGDVDIIDPMKERRLAGNVQIENLSASVFNSLLSPGETAEGTLYGDLRLAGTLSEPQVFGQAGIRQMRVDSTKLPFEMLPSSFELAFNGNKSTLSGELKTPKGGLTLQGDADWKTLAQGSTRIAAKGVKMRVTMPPAVEFDLTTDVHCEASAEKISLNGLIDLPWARVQIYDLPASATDVSADTVRLDRPRLKSDDNSEAIPIESNLFINIGEDVRVDAMGLKARMTGKLHVVQNNGKLGLTGQINVPRGQFKAYGQDLIVRRGEFMFAGAADNPLINLEAIRNPDKTADDVIAGIRVTGQADMPEVTIFTEPEKSQTESLSYLMRGEGLDPAGEDDNSMITSALINLGLSQGSRAIESLGNAVGISGLGVDTEGVGEGSKVAVSGYVLPGLKVKYAVGLFDSLATLTLRYRVIPRLYIEAASGVDQALDVLYSFEF